MGTRIEAAAVTARRGRVRGRRAMNLSDRAANACLRDAGHRADEIELLIHAGIYSDGGVDRVGRHAALSFDIRDGGCGVTTAAQLVDGFVAPGRARLAMIVAADVDPSPSTSRGFPFSPAGGALLLSHVDDDSGFMLFETHTFPEDAALFEAYMRWEGRGGFGRRSRRVLEVKAAPELGERCVDRAELVVEDAFARAALTPADIDLVIASQYPAHFGLRLADRIGIASTHVACAPAPLARAHTAGPIAALSSAMRSGAWARARHTLFVTAGAGLTIGVALYRSFDTSPGSLFSA